MNPEQPATRKLKWVQVVRIAGSLIAVGLLVWLLARQNWREIGENVAQIGLSRFLMAIFMLLCSRAAISLRWYALLRGAGEDISYFSSLRLTFAGLFGNNFLPSTVGGDGIRLAGGIQSGMDGVIVAASLVMDRLVGMASMAVFLPLALPMVLAKYMPGSVGLLLSAVSDPASLDPDADDSPGVVKRVSRWARKNAARFWREISYWARRPRTLVMPMVYSWIHILFTFGMIWVILDGLNDRLAFTQVAGLWAIVYFLTLPPYSVGGMGVQEWAIVLTFSDIAGVTALHALTLGLLFRILMMFVSLPGAAFVPGILEKQKKDEPESDSPV